MSERGKASYSYLSAGSNTTVKSGRGSLYAIVVTPAAGSTVHVVDSVSVGTTPNYNTDLTGTIAKVGPFVDAEPEAIDFGGLGFNTGLTIAATSNARLTVVYE